MVVMEAMSREPLTWIPVPSLPLESLNNAGFDHQQRQRIAPVQRQFGYFLVRDDVANGGVRGLKRFGAVLHRDYFGGIADFERDRDIERRTDHQGVAQLLQCAEALHLHATPVASFRSLTVAPGTTALELSVTVPEMADVKDWAEIGGADSSTSRTGKARRCMSETPLV
jgi:hypothetical protein